MTGAAVLGLGVALLVVWGLLTADRPSYDVLDRNGYFDRWAQLHGGYDPRTGNAWLRGWLTGVHAVARPLARRGVQPDVVTVASLLTSAAVVVLSAAGGPWLLLAPWVLALSGVLDNLDGCVAVLQRRTSRWGYVLDSLVDRVSDALYLVAMVTVGAPLELAAGCGLLLFLLEYARARAGNAGGDDVGIVTMAERPTRVIVLAVTLLAVAVLDAHGEQLATAGTAVLTVMTGIAFTQLLVVVRRQLSELPPG